MFDFSGSSKNIIGVAVTPNIGLEVISIDKKTSQVLKYGHKDLEYNISSREIDNYDLFKSALSELYSDLMIDAKSNIYVVLPSVHFGFASLPMVAMDAESVT